MPEHCNSCGVNFTSVLLQQIRDAPSGCAVVHCPRCSGLVVTLRAVRWLQSFSKRTRTAIAERIETDVARGVYGQVAKEQQLRGWRLR